MWSWSDRLKGESSNPGGDITLIKNEKRKPWLGKFPFTYFYVPGYAFFKEFTSPFSHTEFLYLPVFVSITLLEHRASFSNIKHFEENEKRRLGCAFC